MTDKLDAIEKRYYEVEKSISNPDIISDIKKYTKLSKEYKELSEIVLKYNEYKTLLENIKNTKQIIEEENDEEFRNMAKSELVIFNEQKEKLENNLKNLLIPKDPNDSKNIILEIRGGTGGDEAAIFAGDLFRMYKRFTEKNNLKLEVIDYLEGTSGGYKEIISNVKGQNAYALLKFESGVHRVQRVPATETQGRVHTSAATIVVMPEADEVEVNIDMNEVRKDTFCSSGPGGQSVNTTYSAIRLTHIPTGLVVSCQDEKSQIKNFDKALKVLRARIYEIELKKQQEEQGAERKSMVKSGDRSDKIRTYNYPQGRVTDHRINFTTYNLTNVMDGDILPYIEALRIADNAEKLKSGNI